jgi:GNAT superfamily N-acetyltransferase
MFYVRPGVEGDFPAIIQLIDKASDWLRRFKDTDQWANPWPNEKKRNERVIRGLRMGRTWIVLDDKNKNIVATVTCRPDANKWLWRRQERKVRAVYISRLIINREYEGIGIGTELLDWVGKWARRQYSAQLIRIDVWTTNMGLRSYYQKRGFEFRRVCKPLRYKFRKYPSGALFEKSTAALEFADTPRLSEEPVFHRPKKVRTAAQRQAEDRSIRRSKSVLATAAVAMLALRPLGALRQGKVRVNVTTMGSLIAHMRLLRAGAEIQAHESGADPWAVSASDEAGDSAELRADLQRASS